MKGGELIREARRRAGLSQAELAARLRTKQPVVARWESGRRSPSLETVVRAIRACGLEFHPQIANPDEQLERDITRSLRATPKERLRRNQEMLKTEAWAQRARVVEEQATASARARR